MTPAFYSQSSFQNLQSKSKNLFQNPRHSQFYLVSCSIYFYVQAPMNRCNRFRSWKSATQKYNNWPDRHCVGFEKLFCWAVCTTIASMQKHACVFSCCRSDYRCLTVVVAPRRDKAPTQFIAVYRTAAVVQVDLCPEFTVLCKQYWIFRYVWNTTRVLV